MTEAKFDQNQVPVMTGVLNTNGTTPTMIKATPSTHILDVEDNTTGSDAGPDLAVRDDNGIPVLIAVSETDGVTPVTLYVNSSGQLLIDSN